MSASILEMQRARRALEAFCARRNGLQSGAGSRLICRFQSDGIEILETGQPQHQSPTGPARALVRLGYVKGTWCVYWARENGAWEPYPHLPHSDSVDMVIAELERAPLHVHWG